MTTKHRATLRTVAQFAQSRQDFDCNGTLEGLGGYVTWHTGRMPARYHADYDKARTATDFYAVRSYATPIAWFANGEWHVPNVKYSPTTSRHLSALRLSTRWADTAKDALYVTLAH